MSFSSKDKFKLVKDSLCVEEPNGLLAVMPSGVRDHFFTLDGVAAECFVLFDGKKSLEQIAKKVAAKIKVPQDVVLMDLMKLTNDLLKAKLVEVV